MEKTRRRTEKYISFNVKINVKLAEVSNKYSKEVRENIQLRFIDSCGFVASSLNKLASSLDDDQCKHFKGLTRKIKF